MIWYCFHLEFHNPLAQVQTNSWNYSFSVAPQSTKLLRNRRMKRMVVNENASCNIATVWKMLVSAHKTQTVLYHYLQTGSRMIQVSELKNTGQNEKMSQIYIQWKSQFTCHHIPLSRGRQLKGLLSYLDYSAFPMFIQIPDLFRISHSILKSMLKQSNLYLQQFWWNIEFVVSAIFLLWFHPFIEQHVSTVRL